MQDKTTTTAPATIAPSSDLRIAKQNAVRVGYEASRVATSLRSIARVISDEDNPIDPGHIGGLCEAIELIGERLEAFVDDQKLILEDIEQERLAGGR